MCVTSDLGIYFVRYTIHPYYTCRSQGRVWPRLSRSYKIGRTPWVAGRSHKSNRGCPRGTRCYIVSLKIKISHCKLTILKIAPNKSLYQHPLGDILITHNIIWVHFCAKTQWNRKKGRTVCIFIQMGCNRSFASDKKLVIKQRASLTKST